MNFFENTLNRLLAVDEKSLLRRVFFVSLAIRILVVVLLHNIYDPIAWENRIIADNIIAGRGFSISFLGGAVGFTSWQAPFYPYLLSLLYFTIGKNAIAYAVIEVIQSVATSFVPILIYKAAKIIFDRSVALLTAVLLVPFPLLLWYSTRVHHTAFIFLFISILFYLLIKSDRTNRVMDYVASGAVLGFSLLIEPVILMIFLSFSLWAFARKSSLETVKKISIVAVVALAAIAPWTVRNYIVHGKMVFIKDSFGKEFWLGNNPHATGTGYAAGGREEITAVYPPKSLIGHQDSPEIMKNQLMLGEALNWIEDNPLNFLTLTIKKASYFIWYPPSNLARNIDGGESLKYGFVKKAYWSVLLIFFAYGLFLSYRRKNPYTTLITFIFFSYLTLYTLTHVGQQRFRGVIEPLLVIYASYALISFKRKLGSAK